MSTYFYIIPLKAVSTSGNKFQYVEIEDQKCSHIIDPSTGLGITQQVQVRLLQVML